MLTNVGWGQRLRCLGERVMWGDHKDKRHFTQAFAADFWQGVAFQNHTQREVGFPGQQHLQGTCQGFIAQSQAGGRPQPIEILAEV